MSPLSRGVRGSGRPILARPLATAVTGVLLLVVYYVVPISYDRTLGLRLVVAVATVVLLAFVALRHLARSDDPVGRSVILLILMVLAFAAVFYSLSRVPDQFTGIRTRTDALYFTVVTMATVGYGDAHPVGQVAKAVVALAIVFNLVFIGAIATAVAQRLTGDHDER